VARVFITVGFCLSVATLMACGQGALTPPRPAPQGDIETRVVPPKAEREIPRLLAPPPAYGNKIVMAQTRPRLSQN
jgi:hypothetical protein